MNARTPANDTPQKNGGVTRTHPAKPRPDEDAVGAKRSQKQAGQDLRDPQESTDDAK